MLSVGAAGVLAAIKGGKLSDVGLGAGAAGVGAGTGAVMLSKACASIPHNKDTASRSGKRRMGQPLKGRVIREIAFFLGEKTKDVAHHAQLHEVIPRKEDHQADNEKEPNLRCKFHDALI